MASTPENNGLIVDRNGKNDSTTALSTWLQLLVTNGDWGELGAGTFKTSGTLNIAGGKSVRLGGNGTQSTIIRPTGNTYPGINVNLEGDQLAPSGWIKGLSVVGPTARPSTGIGGIQINETTLFRLEDTDVQNFDMAYDFINNCYDFAGYHMSCSRFRSCNVGINLRAGAQSGSDMAFYHSLLFPYMHSVCAAGNGGGYHFYGGQYGTNNASSSDNLGCIMLCWDYVSQSIVGNLINISFDGIGLEGWLGCHAIRSYGELSAVFRSCSFNASQQSGGLVALDVLKATGMNASLLSFEQCSVSGTFTNAELGYIVGSYYGGSTSLRQVDWYVPPAGYTANGVAKSNPLTDITAI